MNRSDKPRSETAQPVSPPRLAVCQALLRIEREGGYADRLIDQELQSGRLTGPDRALFSELLFGVLRRRGTLDHLLAQLLSRPLQQLDAAVLAILRSGLYQLTALDRVPPHAAINEAVNLARQLAPAAAGLVNAVLRSYLRQADTLTFPDRSVDPAAAIAARHSVPLWLAGQWIGQLGVEEAACLAEECCTPPGLTLRVNSLSTSREALLELLEQNGITAAPGRWSPLAVCLAGRHRIVELPGFQEGLFTVQDEASQVAGLMLGAQPGESVWDACAAPGGKATLIAQQMNNSGELLASDISPAKLRMIQEAVARLGIGCVTSAVINLHKAETLPEGLFDRVLLDAPCSGLGVIRRNPEAKWRLTPADLSRLAAAQRGMLRQTASRLKPGGTLLYSTCSTSREENEEVLADFLSEQRDFVLENLHDSFPAWDGLITPEGMMRAWPHRHGMDGFFAARLRRQPL